MMKLNEVLNANMVNMKYLLQAMEDEIATPNPNETRVEVAYKNFYYFFKEIQETLKAYRHLEMMELISKKKLESIEKAILTFNKDNFLMRVRADEIMREFKK